MASNTKLAVILHCDIVGSTALVARDERVAHERMQAAFKCLAEITASYQGTTHELRGDALLAEFARASDAVLAALEFQATNREANRNLADDIRPETRIGIALGEVVIADSTLTGTGVVVAQRLEQIASAGGVVIQGAVKEAIPQRVPLNFRFLGEQSLKGIQDSVRAFSVEKVETDPGEDHRELDSDRDHQDVVSYCTSADGTGIAYTRVGQGPPLVAVGSWMTHLEMDWSNPMWAHYLKNMARDFTLIRYDQRGNGMSDWEVEDISFERMLEDLGAVIDRFDYDKVILFGPSQASSVSIAYAHRYPERVSHLVLFGAYARGRRQRGNPAGVSESEAMVTFIRQNWGQDNPVARQMMTTLMMPDATRQETSWFNDFQKSCGPAENMARFRELFDDINVADLLTEINIPTLVVHCVGDSIAPLSEGKLIASRIPGAQLVTLNSNSHLVLENEAEFPRFLQALKKFMASTRN